MLRPRASRVLLQNLPQIETAFRSIPRDEFPTRSLESSLLLFVETQRHPRIDRVGREFGPISRRKSVTESGLRRFCDCGEYKIEMGIAKFYFAGKWRKVCRALKQNLQKLSNVNAHEGTVYNYITNKARNRTNILFPL